MFFFGGGGFSIIFLERYIIKSVNFFVLFHDYSRGTSRVYFFKDFIFFILVDVFLLGMLAWLPCNGKV